jgi:hypothetical protein
MHVYLYNLKNPEEFEKNGAKPVFEEIGPFIYKETRMKDNIVDNLNYTISYSDRRFYNFLPDISPFQEDHPITTVNMAAVVRNLNLYRFYSNRNRTVHQNISHTIQN